MPYQSRLVGVDVTQAMGFLVQLGAPLPGETDDGALQRRALYRNMVCCVLCSCYLVPTLRKPTLDAVLATINQNGGQFRGLESIFLSLLTDGTMSYDAIVNAVQQFTSSFDGQVFDGGAFVYNFNSNRASWLTSDTAASLAPNGVNGKLISFDTIPFLAGNIEAVASAIANSPFTSGHQALMDDAYEVFAGTPPDAFLVCLGIAAAVAEALVLGGVIATVIVAPEITVALLIVQSPKVIAALATIAGAMYLVYQAAQASATATCNQPMADNLPQGVITVTFEENSAGFSSITGDSQGGPDPGGGTCSCTPMGTQIQVLGGLFVPIEKLKRGDFVMSEDAQGNPMPAMVVACDAIPRQRLIKFYIHGGETVETTETHTFVSSPAKGRFTAATVKSGAALPTKGGTASVVRVERVDMPRTVYRLSLGGPHTFFVGRAGIKSTDTKQA